MFRCFAINANKTSKNKTHIGWHIRLWTCITHKRHTTWTIYFILMGIGESFCFNAFQLQIHLSRTIWVATFKWIAHRWSCLAIQFWNEYAQTPSTFINLSDESCYSIYDHRSFYLTQTNIQSRLAGKFIFVSIRCDSFRMGYAAEKVKCQRDLNCVRKEVCHSNELHEHTSLAIYWRVILHFLRAFRLNW